MSLQDDVAAARRPVVVLPASASPVLEVILDTEHSHDFWIDAQEEGLATSGPHTHL